VSFLWKRGDVWWYYWSEGGRKRGKSLGTNDEKMAGILKGEEDKRRIFNRAGLSSPVSRWEAFKNEYLDHSRARKATLTHQKDSEVLASFQRVVKPVFFTEISQKIVEQYLNQIAVPTSKANANVHYRHLKAAFNKAVEWDYLPKSPFSGIKQFRIEAKPPRFLSKEEIGSLLEKAGKDSNQASYGLAMVFLYTGMRLAEVLSLRWEAVDFGRGWIKVNGKGSKQRGIPLHPKLATFLERQVWKDGYVFGRSQPMNLNTVQHIFRDRLLPKGTSVHTLRHTFASYAVMSGMDLKTLQEILGHATITTTMIYAHLARPHIEEGMKMVTFR
jgi:Site-specific recombinase XerD